MPDLTTPPADPADSPSAGSAGSAGSVLTEADPVGPRKRSADRPRGLRARHPLLVYVLVRLGVSVLLVLGVTLVTFILTTKVPSSPAAAALGERASADPVAVAAFNAKYGLDKPLPQQYLIYLSRLAHGDLGDSTQTHNPVAKDLGTAFPATAELALTALIIASVLGVGLGLWAALRQRKFVDQAVRVVSIIGISTPTFWLALLVYYLFFYKLGWFPGSGRLDPQFTPPKDHTGFYTIDALIAGRPKVFWNAVGHLILPASVLVLYTVGLLARFARTAVLDVLGSDYITAARAKGLSSRRVTFGYILRGALLPILTVVGLTFGSLLSGAVLTETVFAWNGLGQYAYKAATTLDLQAIMGVGIVVGVTYIAINFVVDLLYGVIDPRVRNR